MTGQKKTTHHDETLTLEAERILRQKYDSRSATIRELMQELGVSRARINTWVKRLGLGRTMCNWTPHEDDYLIQHLAHHSLEELALALKRSERSIQCRAYYLGIDKRSEGYTLLSCAEAFGCRRVVVQTWLQKGWLKGQRRATGRTPEEDYWLITDQDIADFFWEYGHVIKPEWLTPTRWLWLWNLLREAEKPGSRRKRQAG